MPQFCASSSYRAALLQHSHTTRSWSRLDHSRRRRPMWHLQLRSAIRYSASEAIYGRLGQPNEVDLYRFTPSGSDPLPFSVLVPVRSSLAAFRPTVALIAKGLEVPYSEDFPVHLPESYGAIFITNSGPKPRPVFSSNPSPWSATGRAEPGPLHYRPGSQPISPSSIRRAEWANMSLVLERSRTSRP